MTSGEVCDELGPPAHSCADATVTLPLCETIFLSVGMAGAIDQTAIDTELARILASAPFARAPRARKLLTYVVANGVGENARRMKESSIALDVFDRDPAKFDGDRDGIVRVTVNRLRELLDRYYANEGREGAIRFEIPRGSYAPIVRRMVPTGLPEKPRIAVLPLANLTGDDTAITLCDGLTDDAIDALTRIPDTRVLARTSTLRYRNSEADIREIAAELQVDAVLEGSVQRIGSRLRVTAQLILGQDGTHLWSHAFEVDADDRGALQVALVDTVVRSLGKQSAVSDAVVTRIESTKVVAIVRTLLDNARASAAPFSVEGLLRAQALAREATELAPEYAPAWSQLAAVLLQQRLSYNTTWVVPLETFRSAYARALEIDANEPIAVCLRGYDLVAHEYRWTEGLAEAARAVDLAPNNAILVMRLGYLNFCANHFAEARTLFDRALELDPFSPLAYYNRALVEMTIESSDTAFAWLAKGRKRAGDIMLFDEADVAFLLMQRKNDEALQKATVLAEKYQGVPSALMRYGMCLAASGHAQEGRDAFKPVLTQVNPSHRDLMCAWIELYARDYDRCFDFLDRAIDAKASGCPLIACDEEHYQMADDPRWSALMTRLNRSSVSPYQPLTA
jgi:TolB-like protein/tetratricopeptide (TPR) repeat protein